MRDFRKSCVYQIYPKSFLDTTGNGLGDLNGVAEKLDYIKELGADWIWLTPFFVSPQNDNGYDIEDYYEINRDFGTMEDFERLIKKAADRGIGLMLDMVFNHTSTITNGLSGRSQEKESTRITTFSVKGKMDPRPPTGNQNSEAAPGSTRRVQENTTSICLTKPRPT